MTQEQILDKLKFDIELRGLSKNTQAEYLTRAKIFQRHFNKPATALNRLRRWYWQWLHQLIELYHNINHVASKEKRLELYQWRFICCTQKYNFSLLHTLKALIISAFPNTMVFQKSGKRNYTFPIDGGFVLWNYSKLCAVRLLWNAQIIYWIWAFFGA